MRVLPHLMIYALLLLSSAKSYAAGHVDANRSSPSRIPVILTTDIGADMDDQWTLAQLALSPEIELRGVVTTHAPTLKRPAAETAARIAREVLNQMPLRRRPPVLAGSSVPLTNRSKPLANAGVNFILQQSRSFSSIHRLPVLITGAATDVASALLSDPTLAGRIEVIAMGFEKWPAGGDSWNVKNDVKAWQVILESDVPVTVGDATVTARDLAISRQQALTMFGERGGHPGRYLASLHTAWLDKEAELCRKVTGSRDVWPIWDQVVIAHLLKLTRSEVYQRPMLNDDLRFIHSTLNRKGAKITWITSIDSVKLWDHFITNLNRARKNRASVISREHVTVASVNRLEPIRKH